MAAARANGKRVTILDGGMSTTLEQLGHDVSGPMWGSEILIEKPEVIQDVHRRWAEAGAELLGTCTYQMTLSGLYASNTPKRAAEIMDRSISLPHAACTLRDTSPSSSTTSAATSQSPGVVLSLGPFGAHLKPSQEYAGVYPSPYGPTSPLSFSPTSSSSSSRAIANHFPSTDAGRAEEQRAELKLAVWHYERLRAFAESSTSAWDKVEWVAFETVPLLTEIRAVRRAIGLLAKKLGEGRRKRFWIASAFPNGLHPQTRAPATDSAEGGHASVDEFVHAAIGPLDALSSELNTMSDGGSEVRSGIMALSSDSVPAADAIGINCTSPAYLPALVRGMTAALNQSSNTTEKRPALVLYPDGGAVYDTTTKTWTNRTNGAQDWATDVAAIAREAAQSRSSGESDGEYAWAGVIVGGCCKAGFEEIRLLKQEMSRQV